MASDLPPRVLAALARVRAAEEPWEAVPVCPACRRPCWTCSKELLPEGWQSVEERPTGTFANRREVTRTVLDQLEPPPADPGRATRLPADQPARPRLRRYGS